MVVGGSKIHERLAHFFIDIYNYMRYGKQSLAPFYLQAENIRKVISAMERD